MAESDEDVIEYLRNKRVNTSDDVLVQKLNDLGVNSVADLSLIEEDDLKDLRPIIKRRIWSICQSIKGESQRSGNVAPSADNSFNYHQVPSQRPVTPSADNSFNYQVPSMPGYYPYFFPQQQPYHTTMMMPPQIQFPYSQQPVPMPCYVPPPAPTPPPQLMHQYQAPVLTAKPKFKIRYIMCTDLFTSNKEEQVLIHINPETNTMKEFVDILQAKHNLHSSLQLELFTEDGYPLNINPFTAKLTLRDWKIHNDDAFYVFVRRLEQPAWSFDMYDDQELKGIEPSDGSQCVDVLCQVFGEFVIHINPKKDDISTVKKKIAKHINVNPCYLEIHQKIGDYPTMKSIDDIVNDKIFVRLKSIQKLLRQYGKPSYVPMQEQTEKGIAKFYSILLYLTESDTADHRGIVAFVMKLTGCLPMATALHHLFNFKTISHLSYLVALYEGFYFLSRAILEYFCEVNLDQTFEFSDYIFGLIVKGAKDMKNDEFLAFVNVNLTCPITGRKMLQPFYVKGATCYEYLAAKEAIENSEALPECSDTDISINDLICDDTIELHLIATSFSPPINVPILERKYRADLLIPPLSVPCTMPELSQSASFLQVMSPDCEVFGEGKALTFIHDGNFAILTDTTKGLELAKVIYNSLTCKEETYNMEEMKAFVCHKSKVTHNIINFLNAKVRGRLSEDLLTHSSIAIYEKKDISEITREPKEAIMILFDTSASMGEAAFRRFSSAEESKYSRLRAAQDFFAAFANRTRAYDLHHVMGVICFNTDIKVSLPLCEAVTHFKSTLEATRVSNGQTALYDAIKKASDMLSDFSIQHPLCKRRILCLTDGEDNQSQISAYEIAKILQKNEIVLDTVLVTAGLDGHPMQKAISHATGGLCFLPESTPEGLRLFETECLLSIRQRTDIKAINLNDEDCLIELKSGKYDSSDPFTFKSQLYLELQNTTTCSARRMVLLASFTSDDVHASKHHVKQVLDAMKKYVKNPHEDIEIFPNDSNICNWKILLRAPKGTPYQNGIYLLFAKFPENYPYKPPEMRFVTPIYHCNINSMGRICHPILGRNYVPSLSMRDILDQIYGLLMAPEADDPLDSILADEYHTNKTEYFRKAQELSERHACKISWEEYKKTLTEEDADVAQELLCPLTGHLFIDPVSTPYGHVYERQKLLEYLAKNNNCDPLAKKPVRVDDLRPERTTKALAEKFRKANLV